MSIRATIYFSFFLLSFDQAHLNIPTLASTNHTAWFLKLQQLKKRSRFFERNTKKGKSDSLLKCRCGQTLWSDQISGFFYIRNKCWVNGWMILILHIKLTSKKESPISLFSTGLVRHGCLKLVSRWFYFPEKDKHLGKK